MNAVAGGAQVTGTTSKVPVLGLLGQNSDFYLFAIKTPRKDVKSSIVFFEFVSMDDLTLRQKQKKNKGDRDFKLPTESFTSSFGRLRQKIAPKSVQHVQHDYFSLIQPIKSLICGVVVLAGGSFVGGQYHYLIDIGNINALLKFMFYIVLI